MLCGQNSFRYAFQSVSLGDALANFTMSAQNGGVRCLSLLSIKKRSVWNIG